MTRAIAVLRPEPGNAATAARVAALGYRVIRRPLFAVRGVGWDVPDPQAYDSLLLTSANAVRHGGAGLAALTALPVHAVGQATAAAARAAGFSVASVGTGGVAAMAPPGRVLRLVGREYRPLTPGEAAVVVYASDAIDGDLSDLADAVAMVHSPRAARVLADRIADRATLTIAAISAVAAAAAGPGWRAVAVADAPSDAALIGLASALAD